MDTIRVFFLSCLMFANNAILLTNEIKLCQLLKLISTPLLGKVQEYTQHEHAKFFVINRIRNNFLYSLIVLSIAL